MIRRMRQHLAGYSAPSTYSPTRHRQSFDAAFWLVRLYYAATLLFAYMEMSPIWKLMQTGADFQPLWPVFWATDIEATGRITLISLVITSLLAVALPDRRWPKVLVFLAFLSAAAFRSSFGLGSINHGNHYWLWTGFCFCFLPSGGQAQLGASLASRHRFLLVFSFAQGLILLFYSMSGFWKAAAGVEALILGEMGSFHPEALATITAGKMIQIGQPTFLGPWLTDYPLVGWPVHLFVVYIELVALWVWFRPSLHRFFGLTLACFHFGTYLLLGISFPKHVLILTILFIWSPFLPDRLTLADVLASLPGFSRLFRGLFQRDPAVFIDKTADITRPGGVA